jgi:hypothetical protein
MGPDRKQIIRRSVILGVLVALTLSALALASSTSYYNGTTSQKFGRGPSVINLIVSHAKVTGVDVAGVFPNCQNTYQPFNFTQPHALSFAIAHSKFSGRVEVRVETLKKILQINGRFKGHKVSGTLTGTYGTCTTGKVTYKASASSGPSL